MIAQGDTNCDRFYVIETGEVRVMKNENSKRSSLSNDSANEEGSSRAERLATSKRSFEGCAYDPETAKQVAKIGPGWIWRARTIVRLPAISDGRGGDTDENMDAARERVQGD